MEDLIELKPEWNIINLVREMWYAISCVILILPRCFMPLIRAVSSIVGHLRQACHLNDPEKM